jgi:hypothetical protein
MIGVPLSKPEEMEDEGPEILSEAAHELATMDTFVSNWARNSALEDLESRGGQKLPPEALNEKYKDVEVPFSTPMSELAAYHLNEEGAKRRKLKEAIASAPGSDFYKGTVNFAQGILAHAMDPVEFGVGAAAGWSFQAAGWVMARSASAGIARTTGQMLSKQGFAFDAIEGVAGNLALEPYMYDSAQKAQTDYSVADAAMSVLGGGLAFPALKYAGGKSVDLIKKLPESTFANTVKSGLGQLYAGKKPDVEIVKETFDELAYGKPATPTAEVPGTSVKGPDYAYEPRTAGELKTQTVYAASRQAGTLDHGSRPVGDLRFGDDGLYITDNPNAANNLAAHPLDTDGPAGDVFSARIDDANLLDLDLADREVLENLGLKDDLLQLVDEADDVNTAYQMLVEHADETGDDSALKEFMGTLREQGYDGFKYSDDVQGHNSAYIFPESKHKVVSNGMTPSDPKAVPQMNKEKLGKYADKMQSRESELHFDEQTQKEFDSFAEQPSDAAKMAQETLDEKMAILSEMEKTEVLDADDLAAFNKIKEMKKNGDQIVKVIEDFANCLIAGAD